MSSRRTARGNRLGLALVGLALLGAAGYTLLRVSLRLPGQPATDPVIPAAFREFARSTTWFWPTMAGGVGLIGLLALRWLLVQLRTGRVRRLVLEEDRYGTATLDARLGASSVADEIASLPGVHGARATFVEARDVALLRVRVVADRQADVGELRTRVLEILEWVRHSLEVDSLPALVQIRLGRVPWILADAGGDPGGGPARRRRRR
jgi:hypothetical protein